MPVPGFFADLHQSLYALDVSILYGYMSLHLARAQTRPGKPNEKAVQHVQRCIEKSSSNNCKYILIPDHVIECIHMKSM